MIEVLRDGLESNNSLRVLKLEKCDLGETGSKIISELLKHKKWKELFIGYNRIGSKGAEYIFEALKENQHLKSIHLDSNRIMNDGMKQMFTHLKANHTLEIVSLYSNNIVESGYLELIELLKVNHSLLCVYSSKLRKYHNSLNYYFTINQMLANSHCWSFDKHFLFDQQFQEKIKTFLLCQNHFLDQRKFLKIPKPILCRVFDIFAYNHLLEKKKNIPPSIEQKNPNRKRKR